MFISYFFNAIFLFFIIWRDSRVSLWDEFPVPDKNVATVLNEIHLSLINR